MFRARILAAAVLLGAFAAFAASPASAARPGLGYPETLNTTHFQIHFTGDLADPGRITDQQAGDLGQLAEQAYTTEITTWGYPAPPDDGDGRIDVWVDVLGSGLLGLATPDGAVPGTGWIAIDTGSVDNPHTIAHELFHLIQFGIWEPSDSWLLEATAEWAGFAADSFDPAGAGATSLADTVAQPDMSLDCLSDACGPDDYENKGYSRWPFFEYLAERYGNLFIKDVFNAGAAAGAPPETGLAALSSAIAAKGTTIGDAFTDYTLHAVAGNFTAVGLQGLAPTTFSTLPTGNVAGSFPVLHVAVNHLAARYLSFTRGTSGDMGPCYAATLALTVALPAGAGSKPSFYSTGVGTAAIPLTITGTTASLTVPWNTCFGGPDGYLALPNPSTTLDSQVFTVSGSLTVDFTTPSSATAPPAELNAGPGPVIAAPTGDVAPSIYLYGAQVLRVSATDRMVRLIVFSSGPGMLQAAAGRTNLGTYQLRPGNNDVRFKLPQSLVNTLRRPAGATAPGAASLLTLTCLSPTGTASGTVVSRKLAIVKPAPKPTPKKKSSH